MCRLYCIHDSDPRFKRKGAFEIKKSEAQEFNKQGYGIFFTPNDFKGARKAENLIKINYWLADIDDGSKEEQMERIKKLPMKPTIIVETKKGYHCYWKAIDPTIENYRDIEKGLIKRLVADPACKDVSRLLRYPNNYHLKDPKDPFMVKIVENNKKEYSEEKMLFAYKLPEPVIKKLEYKGDKEDLIKQENWDKIFKLNTIGIGGRNNNFSRIYFWLRDEGFDQATIENTILRMNQSISNPLDSWEINAVCRRR